MKKELIFSLICLLALFKGYGAELRRSHSCPAFFNIEEDNPELVSIYESGKELEGKLLSYFSPLLEKETLTLKLKTERLSQGIIMDVPESYQEILKEIMLEVDILKSNCFSFDALMLELKNAKKNRKFYSRWIERDVEESLYKSIGRHFTIPRKGERCNLIRRNLATGNLSGELQEKLKVNLDSYFDKLKKYVKALYHYEVQEKCIKQNHERSFHELIKVPSFIETLKETKQNKEEKVTEAEKSTLNFIIETTQSQLISVSCYGGAQKKITAISNTLLEMLKEDGVSDAYFSALEALTRFLEELSFTIIHGEERVPLDKEIQKRLVRHLEDYKKQILILE